jgi:hypothetical protein
MKRNELRSVLFAIAAGFCLLAISSAAQKASPKPPASKTTASQDVPAEYQAGIAQMRIAKGYLEKAGDKWGGYRVKGIASIDHAFQACRVSPESTPDEMQSGNVDEPGMMNNGIASLDQARQDFDRAGSNWDGRREKALAFIDQALKDLQVGIDWAKQHNTY